MRAFVLIRNQPCYRREAFVAGLASLGYEIHGTPHGGQFQPSDVLVIWNRYGHWDLLAQRVERDGGKVLIAENGYLGRDAGGDHWYALARSFHNGGGWWPRENPNAPLSQQRWQRLGFELKPWRKDGDELVVLATRGIGPQGIREPDGWSDRIAAEIRGRCNLPVRIRRHPGEKPCIPLEKDLARARAVITWGSGGALKALLAGIPVFFGFPKWIGGQAGGLIGPHTDFARPTRGDRLSMFQQLAWAMWRTSEITTGAPFKWLLT